MKGGCEILPVAISPGAFLRNACWRISFTVSEALMRPTAASEQPSIKTHMSHRLIMASNGRAFALSCVTPHRLSLFSRRMTQCDRMGAVPPHALTTRGRAYQAQMSQTPLPKANKFSASMPMTPAVDRNPYEFPVAESFLTIPVVTDVTC